MVSERDIAILGCGPAGLLAAYACEQLGLNVSIISKAQRSVISGAQYLHDPIPGLTPERPDGQLNYIKWGSARGYANKVYGSPDHPCSWDKFPEGLLPAWSMFDVYNRLWEKYSHRIWNEEVGAETLDEIKSEWPMVISSIPLRHICKNPAHVFNGARIWIAPYAALDLPDNTIHYDGTLEQSWYRCSRIFGEEGTESTIEIDGAEWTGIKPTGHTCDCHPDVTKVGRFGQWKKGVLIHHAYNDALVAAQEYVANNEMH